MKSSILVLFLCFFASGSAAYADRQCGSDLSNLWVDVVAVIDTSLHMTQADLNTVTSHIESLFSNGTRIGTDPKEPRTTQIGLVTYNWDSSRVDDLNQFHNLSDLHKGLSRIRISNERDSIMSDGLRTAWSVLKDGSRGANYKQVIIVYTDFYDPQYSSLTVAKQLKEYGIIIITVGIREDANLQKYLSQISSPSLNFNMSDVNVVGEVQRALLDVNCYCPQSWVQYQSKFGVCVLPINLNTVWRAAQSSCRNQVNNGYLLNEYSQEKHDFVLNLIQNTPGFSQPYMYHIGLFMKNGTWVWDQPNGWSNPVLQNWTNWDGGSPVTSSSMSVVLNAQKGTGTVWRNIGAYNTGAGYVCEVAACDTDNYCEYRDDN